MFLRPPICNDIFHRVPHIKASLTTAASNVAIPLTPYQTLTTHVGLQIKTAPIPSLHQQQSLPCNNHHLKMKAYYHDDLDVPSLHPLPYPLTNTFLDRPPPPPHPPHRPPGFQFPPLHPRPHSSAHPPLAILPSLTGYHRHPTRLQKQRHHHHLPCGNGRRIRIRGEIKGFFQGAYA